MLVALESFAVRTTEFLGELGLQVHAAEKIGEARVGEQRIEQFILADSQHNPDGLNGSGDNPLTICVDLYPEAK
jgi:hypothetical protein